MSTNMPNLLQVDPVQAFMRAAQGDSSGLAQQPQPQAPVGMAPQPTQPQPNQLAQLIQQVSQIPQYQQPTQALSGIQSQEQDIQQKMLNQQLPQMAPKNVVVRALLGLTGPGRAIQSSIYGPGVARYGQQRQQMADQLAALKQQETVPTEELKSLSSMAGTASLGMYRSGELENQRVANEIKQQRVDAYSQMVKNRLATAMRGLDLKQMALGSEIELNKARAALDRVMPSILEERNSLVDKGIDVRSATEMATTNVRTQLGIDEKHPLTQLIDNWFGTGLTPAAPTTPGPGATRAPSPLPKSTPQQQKKAGKIKGAGTTTPNIIIVKPEDMR